MKFLRAVALMGVFLLPNFVSAACVANGATVVYVNGVFTTEEQASADLDSLHRKYIIRTGDSKTTFINGYNPSHLGGAGDLAQSAAQIMGKPISSFDLNTILLQIYPQVTTRKLLLVGHSQGALYSNALYDYLYNHGEPKAAIGVYQVGSPASYVAGGGKYLNSSSDVLLITLREFGLKPLPDNIDLAWSSADAQAEFPGHSFSGAYLAEAPDRIVGDMQSALKGLEAKWPSNTGDCFTAPNAGLGYQAAKAGFAVADTAASGIRVGAGAVQVAAVAAGNTLAAAAQGAYGIASKLVADIGITVGGIEGISHAAEPSKAQTNFDVVSRIYGSSVSKGEYKDLVGDMGGAVATAPILSATSDSASQPIPEPQPDLPLIDSGTAIPLLSGSGGARHHNAPSAPSAPAPEASASDAATTTTGVSQDEATTSEPVAAATDEATTTPPADEATSTPEAPTLAFMHGGSPVTDSFDSYDGSGWETYGSSNNWGPSPGVIKYFATTTDCHSGGCLSGPTQTGNGGYGNPMRMYKTGTPVAEGSVAIWRKYHTGYAYQGNMLVMVCVGAPDSGGNKCDGIGDIFIGDAQDVWNEYYIAWRNNGTAKEFCTLRYNFDPSNCVWRPSSTITADEAPDTVVISGNPGRPDLGDRLWFDDLGSL